ncbi:hypothetical protein FRC07_006070 [Ceratobasidium sp. 392]|nr:hypothetical protein FRC07_006070 [Ceratobasidium sp. 392]
MSNPPIKLTSGNKSAKAKEPGYTVLTHGQAAKQDQANSNASETTVPEHLTVLLLRRQDTPFDTLTPSTQPSTPSTRPSTPLFASEIEPMDLTSDDEHLSNVGTAETMAINRHRKTQIKRANAEDQEAQLTLLSLLKGLEPPEPLTGYPPTRDRGPKPSHEDASTNGAHELSPSRDLQGRVHNL